MVQSVEIFSIPLLNLGLLFGTFALLLGGAEIFTNSVEWLGHHLGESVLILVFGEIVPKSYGLGHAQSWSLRVAHPVSYVERALGPLVALFHIVTRWFTTLVGGDQHIEDPYLDD